MDHRIMIYENLLPEVTTVGRFEVKESWVHNRRNFKINTMLYVVKGTVFISEEGVDYEVHENSVFFFKGGSAQVGTKPIEAGTYWYWVSFEACRGEATSDGIKLPKLIDCSVSDRIYKTLMRMSDLYISDLPYKSQVLDGCLHQIFYELLNNSVRQSDGLASKKIAPKVIRLLNKQLEEKFSADAISEKLEMNYCYIGRLFKAETGMSINQYYMKLKVNQAINLLHTSDMNIAQISDKLNYPNQYYFSRVFKKITGMSPSEYKEHMY